MPDSEIEDHERPPHDGEYVGIIEVVVLRCHSIDKRTIIGNEASSHETSDSNEPSMPGHFDGADDPEPESMSTSRRRPQIFGLDGCWDDWGPPPAPPYGPKMGRIEMTSENTGTWNPVGQDSKSSNVLEKTQRWGKRSESRDHFQSDFQKHGSLAGSQRGGSDQSRSIANQENTTPLNLRGGGPGSYSVASSEAMRNWNCGPPVLQDWTQEDAPSKENEGLPAAFDPWKANLPTGDFTNEAETMPQTEVGAWGTRNETKNKLGSKKGSMKDVAISRNSNPIPGAWGESKSLDEGKSDDWVGNNDPNQGNNGNDWGGAGNANAQRNDKWNAGGNQSQEKDDDWNNNGGTSSWDAPKNDEKRDDGAWDPPNDTSNGNNGWYEDSDTKQTDGWGATTGNSWRGDTGQQTDTWGENDTRQVTTGAKDLEKQNKPTSNQQAARTRRDKAGSALSFGNSRAKGTTPASKAGSQVKPASVKLKAASINSNERPSTFNWLKPSLEKKSNASGPPVAVKKASVPGVSPKQWEPKPVAAQVPPTFSVSTPPKPKPYWSKWRNPNTISEVEMEEEQAPSPEEFEEPVYSIPAEVAQRNMMSHQVRPGRPAAYTHKRNKPKYMDTHESPYAVFLFKYRGKEIIEHMLKTAITESEVDEKARLASLSKQELINELMKTKSKLSLVESGSSGQATFVKKLDEKLSKLETSKQDAPAIDDWVKTTSPTDGQGTGNSGEWGNDDAWRATGAGDSGNGNKTSNTNGGNRNDDANGNGEESRGGNGGNNVKVKSDWRNNGHGEVSYGADKSGGGWGATDRKNGGDKNDDHGGDGNDHGGGGDWSGKSHNDKDNSGDRRSMDHWGNDNGDAKAAVGWDNDSGGTGAAGDWGNDNNGGESWDAGGGGGGGGWGGDADKEDKGNRNGNSNTGGHNAWGVDADGGGGGGGGW